MQQLLKLLTLATALAASSIAHSQERTEPVTSENSWIFAPVEGRTESGSFFRFDSSNEANEIIKEIMTTVSLPADFKVFRGPVGNAAARIEGSQRVIFYSEDWIQRIIKLDRWSAVTVLAHEIAHHLAAHTLAGVTDRQVQELEADRFAGATVARLGGTLEDAQRVYKTLATRESKTHPSRRTRLEAVAIGYADARQTLQSDDGTDTLASIEQSVPEPISNKVVQPPEGAVLRSVPKPPERLDLSGAEIAQIQTKLNLLGFDAGVVDGVSGQQTAVAVDAFQRSSGVEANGVLDERTYALLESQRPKGWPPVNGDDLSSRYAGNWIYIGIYQGNWLEKNFRWAGHNNSLPRSGQVLSAVTDVHVRAGHIELVSGRWINKNPVGVLKNGSKIKISEVKDVTERYNREGVYWARISP